MHSLILILLTFLCSLSLSLHAADKIYQIDIAPLQAEVELAQQYELLQAKFQNEALTTEEHQKRLAIVQEVLKKKPDWYDGYWLLAAETFFIGSSYTNPKDHALARKHLVVGEAAAVECLKRKPDYLLCRFFKASVRAKIASIDGILASLSYGKMVRKIWQDVVNSGVDFQFRPNVSLQGSAHYALGLFYRLVPNFFLMNWIFGIRGDIDESIRYHRAALKYDGSNPCYQLMLSVALFCKVKGNPKTAEFTEAMKLLEAPAQTKALDVAQAACVHDVPTIRDHPQKTCGYTQAKYQDDVKEHDLKS